MSDGLEHMDDAFKRMGEEMNFSYDKSLWDQMSADLDDAAMDDAFVNAADNLTVSAAGASFAEVEDAFMDDAFLDASSQTEAVYSSNLWNNFVSNEADLYMDDAFVNAAKAAKAEYSPAYWGMANAALTSEGLHHEYKPVYWEEARSMLEQSDRKGFFYKWSAVAAVLLLISFLGMNSSIFNGNDFVNAQINRSIEDAINKTSTQLSNINTKPELLESRQILVVQETEEVNSLLPTDEASASYNNKVDNVNTLEEANNVEGSDIVINRAGDSELNNEAVDTDDLENNLLNNEASDGNLSLEETSDEISSIALANEIPETVELEENLSIKAVSNELEETEIVEEVIHNATLNNSVELNISTENESFEMPDFELNKISFNDELGFNSDIINKWTAPEIQIVKSKILPSHVVSLNIQTGYGIQYGLGFIPPSMRNTVGISWATTYGKLKRFELGLELSASRNIQNNLGIEERVTVYDVHGGATRSWMKYQIKDAYYTGVGFNFNYNINNKHKILTSVTGSYLTAVRSNMSHQINADEITTINDNWGAMDGLKKMDVLLGLGYQFNLGRAFAISIKGQYGLFDRTDNDFLGESLFDHETNVQIGLHYNIFTKH